MAANESNALEAAPDFKPNRIADLRSIATAHLLEIAAEDSQEQQAEMARLQAASPYLHPRRKPRPKSKTQSKSKEKDVEPLMPAQAKAPKLRSAQDVLHRLRHDPAYAAHTPDISVGYLERFDGIREMPLNAWIGELTDEDWIPQHRIKYFRLVRAADADGGEFLWHRALRIDKIFGSGLGDAGESELGEGAGAMGGMPR